MKNEEKVLLGVVGAAAIGLAVKAVQIIKDRKVKQTEELELPFDLEDLNHE